MDFDGRWREWGDRNKEKYKQNHKSSLFVCLVFNLNVSENGSWVVKKQILVKIFLIPLSCLCQKSA